GGVSGGKRFPPSSTGGYGDGMSIKRESAQPAGITNASGQPEIVLEIAGLVLSMTPPGGEAPAAVDDDTDQDDS
ncbi:MAG: hypothetical protein JWN99_2426, partial [Ilumatobacteraceae bacterium]|nr:hypothetical protein [Ilumatobacteraceae bacterium]